MRFGSERTYLKCALRVDLLVEWDWPTLSPHATHSLTLNFHQFYSHLLHISLSLLGWDSDLSSILLLLYLIPPSSQGEGRKRAGKMAASHAEPLLVKFLKVSLLFLLSWAVCHPT